MADKYGVYAELTGTAETPELVISPASNKEEVTYRVHGTFTGTVYVVLRRPDEPVGGGEILDKSEVTAPADKLITLRGPYAIRAKCTGLIGTARVELFGTERG